MTEPHANRDPITDNCLDCGALRGEITDGLATTCEKVTGPNRLAIIIGQRELRHQRYQLERARHRLRRVEDELPAYALEIRAIESVCAELARSIEILKKS